MNMPRFKEENLKIINKSLKEGKNLKEACVDGSISNSHIYWYMKKHNLMMIKQIVPRV